VAGGKEMNEKLVKLVLEQTGNRRNWQEYDTPEQLSTFILEETQELGEAITKAEIGDGAFEVASEIGDILYLYIKLDETKTKIPDEVEACFEYALSIAELTGINPDDALNMKIIRNDMKYLNTLCNNGFGYAEAVSISKQQWKLMGGDSRFSEMYMELGDSL